MIAASQAPNFLVAAPLIRTVEQVVSLGGSSAFTVEDPDW
jgi:hypothetical protein